MRYHNILLLISACFFTSSTFSHTLSEKIDSIIEQQLPHAAVGVSIKDLQTGEVIYSKNANTLLSPASSTKLFTATAALYQLTPDYRFLTTLSQKDQNYYIKFTGSPSLTDKNLSNLIQNVAKNKVKEIKGDIILDTTQYQPPYYLGGDSYDDLGWAYTSPDTAVILNINAERYDFISGEQPGTPLQINSKKPSKALTLINQLKTVSKEEEKHHCGFHIEIQAHNTLRLFGCMVYTKEAKTMEFAIPDPVLFAKQIIKNTLKQNGITFTGSIIEGPSPADALPIANLQSAPLAKLVTHMLQKSDNLYANTLTRQLGYSVTGKGTHKEGAFAIKKIVGQHTHLDMTQLQIADGEGTRYNLITPEQLVVLLQDVYNDKQMQPLILSALPQAGVSGTLQTRMKKTILEKKVFAKTGTMHDVSSLSGYVINPNARSLVFSIIINSVNKPISTAKLLEEKILLAVVSEK